jgi:hypothetical protein
MCILFLIFACNAPNKEDPRARALKSFEKDGVPSLKYLALQFALDMNNNVGGICTVMHSPESSDFTTEYGAGFASCKLKEVKDSRDSMLFIINHTNCQTTGTAKEGLPPCLVALRTQYSCLLDRATALDIVTGRSTQAIS